MTNLHRERVVDELELGPLDAAETSALAAGIAGRPLDPRTAAELYRNTEGNPLFVVEAMRAGDQDALPPTVQALIEQRLAQPSPAARELVGVAATIGHAIAVPVLTRAAGSTEAEVVRLIDELAQRRILHDRGDGVYDFNHDKIRAVAYSSMSGARRRVLHGRAADAIETLQPDLDNVSTELAMQHEQAGQFDRAIWFRQRSAQVARRVFANADAIAHLQHATALLESWPRTPGTDSSRASFAATVYESLGDVLTLTADHSGALAAYGRAQPFVAVENTIQVARLYRKLAAVREGLHDFTGALSFLNLADAALGAGPTKTDPESSSEWIAIRLGRFQIAYWTADLAAINELGATLGPAVERYGTPAQQVNYLVGLVGLHLRHERYVPSDQTVATARAALQVAVMAGPAANQGQVEFTLGFVLLWRGELGEAEAHLASVRAFSERIGDVAWQARATFYLATLNRLVDRPDQAKLFAEEALALPGVSQMREYAGGAYGHLVWAAMRRNDAVTASVHARALRELWASMPMECPFLWQGLWPLLELAVAEGDVARATGYARILLDEQQQRVPEPVASTLAEGTAAWDRADSVAARGALDAALAGAHRNSRL